MTLLTVSTICVASIVCLAGAKVAVDAARIKAALVPVKAKRRVRPS